MIIINSWSVWHLPAFRQEKKKRRLKITKDYKRLRTKITKKKKKKRLILTGPVGSSRKDSYGHQSDLQNSNKTCRLCILNQEMKGDFYLLTNPS